MAHTTAVQKNLELLTAGTQQVLPADGLEKKLQLRRPLNIKLGADPTAPDLHLGHAVVLKKMRQFQELGHNVIFLIGDYTARIGDPSGKSKTRPALSQDDIASHMNTYFEQVGKILDPRKTTIVYNSTWLTPLNGADWLSLCAKITLAQLTEREDFAKRLRERKPIGLHELMYPLMQAYDSVELKADVELGGTDQTFNLLLGRDMQEAFGQKPQVVMTMPLLEGTDGVHKMSKSLGNAIGLAEPADQVFGKLMSISDELMWRYFSLLLGTSDHDISQLQERVAAGNLHPKALKKEMAHAIVAQFWSTTEADAARRQFEDLFEKRDYQAADEFLIPADTPNPVWIVSLLGLLGVTQTNSQARRLIEQGAVSIDGKKITDAKHELRYKDGMIIKAGKHAIFCLKTTA